MTADRADIDPIVRDRERHASLENDRSCVASRSSFLRLLEVTRSKYPSVQHDNQRLHAPAAKSEKPAKSGATTQAQSSALSMESGIGAGIQLLPAGGTNATTALATMSAIRPHPTPRTMITPHQSRITMRSVFTNADPEGFSCESSHALTCEIAVNGKLVASIFVRQESDGWKLVCEIDADEQQFRRWIDGEQKLIRRFQEAGLGDLSIQVSRSVRLQTT